MTVSLYAFKKQLKLQNFQGRSSEDFKFQSDLNKGFDAVHSYDLRKKCKKSIKLIRAYNAYYTPGNSRRFEENAQEIEQISNFIALSTTFDFINPFQSIGST